MTKSIFEDIPGMGKKRIRRLWQEFSSLQEVRGLKMEDIRNRTGFPEKRCEAILDSTSESTS